MTVRRITSRDVARRAGVSRTTVSFVLNDVPGVNISQETRKRVLQAAQELGYVPDAAARSLASRRTHTLGLVLVRNQSHIAADAFLPQVIHGLAESTRQAGFRPRQNSAGLSALRENRFTSLIVLSSRRFARLLDEMNSKRYKAVRRT